jgi:hypothetical protein
MTDEMGVVEVDLFSAEVDSLDHPEIIHFKGLLEEVAEDYRCSLLFFDVHLGTVTFAFDNEELMANILNILQDL